MGALEELPITVLSKGVIFPAQLGCVRGWGGDSGRFPDGTTLLQNVTGSL